MDEDHNRTGGGGTAAAGLSARAPFIVAAAVVAGIGLYLVIHHSPAATVHGTTPPSVTTPTTAGPSPVGGLPVTSMRLIIVNGAGTSATAAAKIATLKRLGYPIVTTVAGAATTGTTVQCKSGLSAQASALARALGSGAVVKPFPSPAPPIAPLLECLVTIGK